MFLSLFSLKWCSLGSAVFLSSLLKPPAPNVPPVVYTDVLLRETLTVASLISGLMINDVGLVWHHVQVTETLKSKKVVVCCNQLSGLVVRSLVVDHYNPFRLYAESIGSSCKQNFLHVCFYNDKGCALLSFTVCGCMAYRACSGWVEYL